MDVILGASSCGCLLFAVVVVVCLFLVSFLSFFLFCIFFKVRDVHYQ